MCKKSTERLSEPRKGREPCEGKAQEASRGAGLWARTKGWMEFMPQEGPLPLSSHSPPLACGGPVAHCPLPQLWGLISCFWGSLLPSRLGSSSRPGMLSSPCPISCAYPHRARLRIYRWGSQSRWRVSSPLTNKFPLIQCHSKTLASQSAGPTHLRLIPLSLCMQNTLWRVKRYTV